MKRSTGLAIAAVAVLIVGLVFLAPGSALLDSTPGLVLAIALAAAATTAFAFTLGSMLIESESALGEALRPYSEGYVAEAAVDPDAGRGRDLVETRFVRKAVELTGRLAERRGVLDRAGALLERANLPLRPAEGVLFYGITVVLTSLLAWVLTGSAAAALLAAAVAALAPAAAVSFLAGRRRKRFQALLPDTLQLLASTLRAGYSLMQGVEAVSQEVGEPMGQELRRVVTEARLGRPLEESLEGVAERMESGDFDWAVMAIGIQREVGGNLSELLVTVAATMTERERLRRDVSALTAEGKISAFVLGILPLGLGAFIYAVNPGYLDPLFDTTLGQVLLMGSGVLALLGFWWMKKIIEVDI